MHSNMFTKISKLITRDIEVTQEFIDFRDGEIAKGSYNSKNNYKNCDYLLLEWWLKKYKLVNENSHEWRHDFIIKGLGKIDVKWIKSIWFNIKENKTLLRLKKSIEMKELDYFLFYTHPEIVRKYVVGDVLSHKFINIVPANVVINSLGESSTKGWYYPAYKKFN